jgi:glycosyltransferase involved in cell wall biosynthesis
MKIAYILLKGMPLGGGIEKYTEEVGSRLVDRGHDVIVYTMRHYGAKDGLYKGMSIRTMPTFRTRCLEKLVASFLATVYQSFEKDIDVVHFHAFGPSMFCFIPRFLARKVIVQGHGLEWKRSRWGRGGRLFLRLTEIPSVKPPQAITVVSEVQKRYLAERYGRESIWIPTGVNPSRIEKPDVITRYGLLGNDYILFAGRLVREKGVHYLVDAYNRIKTDLKLVIAGDAMHEEAYKKILYQASKDNKNIIFTGFATGKLLEELFSNCYLFVLPSEIEGLPIALLEAMSYGRCCLVSDIPENREALNDFGFYFENRNVDELSERLEFLLGNADAALALQEKAKSHVINNYSWDKIALRFEALYEGMLSYA